MISEIIETGNLVIANFYNPVTSQVFELFASCVVLLVICLGRLQFRRCQCLQQISGCEYEIFCVVPVLVVW